MGDGCASCAPKHTETCVRKCAEGSHYKPIPQTNADRIRSMADEELAEHIVKCVEADFFRANVMGVKPNSKDDWLDWLKQEAGE